LDSKSLRLSLTFLWEGRRAAVPKLWVGNMPTLPRRTREPRVPTSKEIGVISVICGLFLLENQLPIPRIDFDFVAGFKITFQ